MLSAWFGAPVEKPKYNTPTPTSKEDYEALYESSLKVLIEHVSTVEGWNKVKEQDGLTLYDKIDPKNDALHLVKSQGVLEVPIQKCFDLVNETSMESRKKWDQDLAFYDVKEQITDKIMLTHVGFTAPMPVASRDFCAIRCTTQIDGNYYFFGCSVIHSSIPEDATGTYVRGTIHISGFYMKPEDENHTFIANVTQVDPAGWIPTWVVNLGKTKALTRLENMRDVLTAGAASE